MGIPCEQFPAGMRPGPGGLASQQLAARLPGMVLFVTAPFVTAADHGPGQAPRVGFCTSSPHRREDSLVGVNPADHLPRVPPSTTPTTSRPWSAASSSTCICPGNDPKTPAHSHPPVVRRGFCTDSAEHPHTGRSIEIHHLWPRRPTATCRAAEPAAQPSRSLLTPPPRLISQLSCGPAVNRGAGPHKRYPNWTLHAGSTRCSRPASPEKSRSGRHPEPQAGTRPNPPDPARSRQKPTMRCAAAPSAEANPNAAVTPDTGTTDG